MKVTIIYGPAASGKTLIAEGLDRILSLPHWGVDGSYGEIVDSPWPDSYKAEKSHFRAEVRRAKKAGASRLIFVTCERPSEDVLVLADYVIEARRMK